MILDMAVKSYAEPLQKGMAEKLREFVEKGMRFTRKRERDEANSLRGGDKIVSTLQ